VNAVDRTQDLLRELSEAHGVAGYEAEVRAVVRRHLEPLGGIDHDRIGSLVCRQGEAGPRVMLAAHMDEIGFMVKHITDDGFVRFLPLGGWWDQVILGQCVVVKTHKGDLPGTIGAKPPHVLPQEERKKVVEQKDMYIDIGATSKAQVEEAGVRLGDPVVPDSAFRVMANPKVFMGKGFDDRVGLALMIETMNHFAGEPHPNVLHGVATVMEEVGLRGAKTSADLVNPDVAIILESDICGDVPGIKPEESAVKLGRGPALLLMDARMIPNLKFRDLVIETAKELEIPLQFSAGLGGATDGGQIHLHGTGVPTVVLGVPVRHIHSHAGIMHRDDYDAALRLLLALVKRLDDGTVRGFTA
jgi:putative aminopeptidase FrvX